MEEFLLVELGPAGERHQLRSSVKHVKRVMHGSYANSGRAVRTLVPSPVLLRNRAE
jgi:hypothetical protein